MMSIRRYHKRKINDEGYILIIVLICASIGIVMIAGLVNWAATDIVASRQTAEREQALQIAEAGIDYYRWHLAHAPTDFQDGKGIPGPYTHVFRDKDGNEIGSFTLEIVPPPLGSTLVSLISTASSTLNPSIRRSIAVQFAKPSIAKFAVVSNSTLRFGAGTEVFGPVHSNQGIRFDGTAHNLISSSLTTYDDPDHTGANEFAVHTHVSPTDPIPPTAVPSRGDVFRAGRVFPVPSVDFAGITADLSQMRLDAQSNGFYRPSAGAQGYHIVLKTNDTFDLYRVTNMVHAPAGCTNSVPQTGWGTWSILNQHLIGNFPFPNNGIIFLEDDVFVDGRIDGAKLNIIAAFLPDNPPFRKNIIVNNDLLYTRYDGSDTIGLIAQGNVLTGLVSENDLRIDGALIAQNGFVGRFYYQPPGGGSRCSPNHVRTTLTLWGMIATNQRYGYAYTDGTGYATRNINYDGNLLYAPPPGFPLTGDQYITLSWEER